MTASAAMGRLATRAVGDADRAAWNAFVAAHPLAVSYHRYEWGDVVAGAFGLPRVYLAAFDGAAIRGVLPLVVQRMPLGRPYLTSLPFVNYAGLLASGDEAAAALIEAARGVVRERRATHAELRSVPGFEPALPSSRRKIRPVLALPKTPEELLKAFGSKLRSQIKRPQNEGMLADDGERELLDEFFDVVSTKWRALGSPIFGRRVFETLFDVLPGENRIVRVRAGNVTVGAGWLHTWRDETEIIWAATRREYDRFSPNMLLYWHAMQLSIANGVARFDFGRSTEGAGTHRFKLQWGPEVVPLPWHYVLADGEPVPAAADASAKAALFKSVWTRLPLSLTRVFGPWVAKRLPL